MTELQKRDANELAVALGEQLRDKAIANAPDAMDELIGIALGTKRAKRYQLQAIVELLGRAGIDAPATEKAQQLFALVYARIVQQAPAQGMAEVVTDTDANGS